MIDFRYHLVSLISVFLALAVGIVLGAGPLRDGISDVLTGQVDQLRTDREDLRSQLEIATRDGQGKDTMIAALQGEANAGILKDQKLSLIHI